MNEPPHYAMVIEWSDEDQAYVVSFPEWEETGLYFVHTHGESYEQAVKNGQEVLAELVAMAQAQGRPFPEPRRYAAAGA
jgi:antitoxin HicB